MGPDPILLRHLEDQRLSVGQRVQARWHDHRGRFSAPAMVVALKPRSVVVELQRATGSHPAGHRLKLPRLSDFEHWTRDYGVMCEKAG